jgi:hypothetical protein
LIFGHIENIWKSCENPVDLSAWKWHPISSATCAMSLFLKDMDLDGDLDIVTSERKPGENNGFRWLGNPGEISKQKQAWG